MKVLPKHALAGLLLFLSVLMSAAASGQTARLIVVDPLVSQELNNIRASHPDGRVVVLPASGNPLSAISAELKTSDYSEIHIYVLTKPGAIVFDEMAIIASEIGKYESLFREWKSLPGSSVTIHSDVLTSVPEGNTIVNMIAEYTGKKVFVE